MVASLLHGSATSQNSLGRHGLVGISRQYQVSVKIRLYLDQYPACLLSTCGRVVRALPYTVRVSPPEYVAAIGAFATVFITATQTTPFMIRILPLVDCFGPIWAGSSSSRPTIESNSLTGPTWMPTRVSRLVYSYKLSSNICAFSRTDAA